MENAALGHTPPPAGEVHSVSVELLVFPGACLAASSRFILFSLGTILLPRLRLLRRQLSPPGLRVSSSGGGLGSSRPLLTFLLGRTFLPLGFGGKNLAFPFRPPEPPGAFVSSLWVLCVPAASCGHCSCFSRTPGRAERVLLFLLQALLQFPQPVCDLSSRPSACTVASFVPPRVFCGLSPVSQDSCSSTCP